MRYRLRRRGIDHGSVAPTPRETSWERVKPEVLRGAVSLNGAGPSLRDAARLIERLRSGVDPVRLLPPLPRPFRLGGVSQNAADPLEMHKVHVTGRGRELYIKINWLSTRPGDASLRLRFSFGTEVVDDWRDDPVAGPLSERLFEIVFPVAQRVTRNAPLLSRIRRRIGGTPRFVQRILYANAPGGGALFHHDYVPGQAGVIYAQVAGSTGWLALPKRTLARHIQEATGRWRDTRALLEYMDAPDPRQIERLINHTGAFTRRLAADGWFFVLRAGDAILLPSRGWDDTVWHSVFTLRRGSNLGLSFGIVAARGSAR